MASVTAQSRNHVVLNASRYVCLWGRVRARRVRSRPVSHLLVYLNEMTRCSGALLHAVLFESCTDVGMTVFRRPAGQSDRQQQQQRRRRQQKIPTQLWKTTAVECWSIDMVTAAAVAAAEYATGIQIAWLQVRVNSTVFYECNQGLGHFYVYNTVHWLLWCLLFLFFHRPILFSFLSISFFSFFVPCVQITRRPMTVFSYVDLMTIRLGRRESLFRVECIFFSRWSFKRYFSYSWYEFRSIH